MIEQLMQLLTWLSQHLWLANLVVFIVALLESFALVGIVMPGVMMMFMFGALIGSDKLPWTIVFWVMAGAISGDALSYWLGHHYRQHLHVMWPFRRYPKLFAMGTNYFYKHGGKSVFFGRFIGPIRPIIAVIAGMMSMPVWQFMLINILSAILWAVLYLLPGVIFSASLSLAAEVAGRLVVTLIALVASLWILIIMTRYLLRVLQPIGHWLVLRMDDWRLNHAFGHRLLYPVFDPQHGRWHEHLLVALMLWGGFLGWGLLLYVAQPQGSEGLWNLATYQFLQSLSSPWGYQLLVMLTQMGSLTTLLPLYLILLPWLLYRRRYHYSILLGSVLLLGELLVAVLKALTEVARPMAVEGIQTGAFPSGHVLMATLFYGALAVMLAASLPYYRRWIPYLTLNLLLFAVTLSRLWLGAHWLSDVVASLLIAVPLLIIIGIMIYRLPQVENLRPKTAPGLALLLVLLGQYLLRYEVELQRYRPAPANIETQTLEQWQGEGWQALPLYRDDLLQHHRPLNLQWLGDKDSIQAYLSLHGWSRTPPQDYRTWLQWLNPTADFQQLLIPNHIHGTRYQDLIFVQVDSLQQRYKVLRLWQSQWQVNGTPVWVGDISYLESRKQLGLHYLATIPALQQGLDELVAEPPLQCEQRQVESHPQALCHFQ